MSWWWQWTGDSVVMVHEVVMLGSAVVVVLQEGG